MKLSINERFKLLLDDNSFCPICEDIPSHFVVGTAKIDTRPVVIFAIDNHSETDTKPYDVVLVQNRVVQEAINQRCPLIMLLDVKEHVESNNNRPPIIPDSGRVMVGADGMGHVYYLLGMLEGIAPRLCLSFGQMAGTTSFFAGLCDAVVMRDVAGACIGRPDAAKKMIGEDVSFENLGGAAMHATTTGMTDAYFDTDEKVISWGKRLLSYLPTCNGKDVPLQQSQLPVQVDSTEIVPNNPDKAFDMHLVINSVIDAESLIELKEHYAKEVITGFARVGGKSVGIIANQSSHRMGILFTETCKKIESFVNICNNFNIPICFMADTPGFMVGSAVERAGLIQSASRLFTTLAKSNSPRMVIVVRRAHSAALYAMAGPGFTPQSFIALPTAAMSIYGVSAIAQFVDSSNLTSVEKENAKEMYNYATQPSIFVKENMLDEIVTIADLRDRVLKFINSK